MTTVGNKPEAITIGKKAEGKFEVRNLGRSKITVKFTCNDEAFFEDRLFKAITPHLMSRDLEYTYYPDDEHGSVFAGFRKVGEIRRVEA